jgi:hypothetical protein
LAKTSFFVPIGAIAPPISAIARDLSRRNDYPVLGERA